MSSNSTMTVAFIGASQGIGLSALKHTLRAGHTCIAMCRTPSKLTDILPASSNPNLTVMQGNAYDLDSVTELITRPDGSFVDTIVTTIGGKPRFGTRYLLDLDDRQVCEKGMKTLVEAVKTVRKNGPSDGGSDGDGPIIIGCSGHGMSRFQRDFPLWQYPLTKWFLTIALIDKIAMEDALTSSGEKFIIARPSILTDGETDKKVRVGVEDPIRGPESTVYGGFISREDTGKWMAEELIVAKGVKYTNKNVSLTW